MPHTYGPQLQGKVAVHTTWPKEAKKNKNGTYQSPALFVPEEKSDTSTDEKLKEIQSYRPPPRERCTP